MDALDLAGRELEEYRGTARGSIVFKRGAVLGFVLLLGGCASVPMQVATYQNRYDYRLNRYIETCQVQAPPATCAAQQATLKRYEKALHEAATALKWGGKMPLQLDALKAADAAAAK